MEKTRVALQRREAVRRQVADLLIDGAAITPAVLVGAGGSGWAPQEVPYDSVDAVLSDIVETALRRVVNDVADVTSVRRRSVTDVLLLGLTAVWDDVTALPRDHRALRMVQLQRPHLVVAGPAGPTMLDRLPQLWVTWWLLVVSRRQDVTWDRPVTELARFFTAIIEGVITDGLCRIPRPGDDDTYSLLRVAAFQLAEHSTRNHRARPRTD